MSRSLAWTRAAPHLPTGGGLSICVLGVSLLVFAGETIDAQDRRVELRHPPTSARIEALRRTLARTERRTVAQSAIATVEIAEPPGARSERCDWDLARWREMLESADLDDRDFESTARLADAGRDAGQQAFDRVLATSGFEPRWDITADLFATARFRELGARDLDDFDADVLSRRSEAFAFDTQRFQRISAGLGWMPTPGTTLKLEGGRDRFSPSDSNRDERLYFGLELCVTF